MDARARDYRLGIALLLLSTLAWSTAGLFTRLIALDAWTILFWRGVFGALTCLLFLLARDGRRTAAALSGMGRPGLAMTLVSALGMTAYVTALTRTSVAHVAIIYATIPFVAAVLARLLLGERAAPATLGASLVAFAGVLLAVAGGAGEGGLFGDALSVVMTLLMGATIVIARGHPGVPMVAAAGLSAVAAAALALPFSHAFAVTAPKLAELALFGVTNMGVGLILFMVGSTRVPAAENALIGTLEAPLAPLWVWLAFGEAPLPLTIAGGALVMAAVVLHLVLGARRAAALAT